MERRCAWFLVIKLTTEDTQPSCPPTSPTGARTIIGLQSGLAHRAGALEDAGELTVFAT